VPIVEVRRPPLYYMVAAKARHLKNLGFSNFAIARHLGVSDKRVAKAVSQHPQP